MRTVVRRFSIAFVAAVALAGFARADDAAAPAPAPANAPASCGVPLAQQPATRLTRDLWDVAATVRRLRTTEGVDPSRVLVVFDIDNTLLAMRTILGSDEWFNLEDALLKKSASPAPAPAAPALPAFCGPLPVEGSDLKPPFDLDPAWKVVKDFAELLAAQERLYAQRPMRATQPDAGEVVRALVARGCSAIALTSRGPGNVAATRRDLAANGISFATRPVPVREGFPTGEFRWADADLGLFSKDELGMAGDPARSIQTKTLYADGVLLTSGANKGCALRLLLSKSPATYSHVLFVDDTARHHVTMRSQFASQTRVQLHTFWYAREHECVRRFYMDPAAMAATAAEFRASTPEPCSVRCEHLFAGGAPGR